jgi:sec-independent protein translocase protein TatC
MAGDHESEHPDEAEGGPVKTFLEHLEDLRWVLIKSLAALGVAILLCLLAGNYVVQIVKWPLTRARIRYPSANQIVTVSFGTNRLGALSLTPEQQKSLNLGANHFVSVQVEPLVIGTNRVLGWRVSSDPGAIAEAQRLKIDLINLGPAGGFVVAFQVAIYGGAVLASPFIFYFVAAFIFPALKLRERKYVYRGLAFGGGLFIAGVAFCYFILMPVALSAAQLYSRWLGFGAFQWRAEDYISFVCKFLLGMGLGFELPVVVLTLVKIGVLDYRTLSKARRYVIVINLILGAVLTTPEPLTQIVMFVPLQVLYEITVWIAWYWDWQERKRAAREG